MGAAQEISTDLLTISRRICFFDRPSAPALACCSDTFDTRPHPLLDHQPLELRKDAHYPKSALPANEEVNLFRVDLREKIDQV